MLGGVALGVAGCVLAISLFRGGVIATRAFYTPVVQVDLPLGPDDDHSTVVRTLGQPAVDRWREERNEQYELLGYPQRRLYVILMRESRSDARYIGALDWNWRPAHAVDLPGLGSSYSLLRHLPKF